MNSLFHSFRRLCLLLALHVRPLWVRSFPLWCALVPAVGPLFFQQLEVRSSFTSCRSSFHRRFAQRLSVTFATLLVRALLARSSWHSMSRPPWHSMAVRHRLFDELSAVHVLTHVFSSARYFTCCAWSASPQHHSLLSLRALRVEVVQSSVAVAVHVHVAIVLWSTLAQGLSVDAIVRCVLLRSASGSRSRRIFESST